LLICISCIIALVYLPALLFILLHCYFILLTFNTLCLTTTQWSGGRKARRLFCRLPDKNEESFSTVHLEFDINPELSSWGKFTLAATLHSWSPDEVAHCLVSSMPEWEICNLMLKHHHSQQGNPIITIITQDRTGKSRSLPPMEGTNLGKSCILLVYSPTKSPLHSFP
jgi:hypothetical protein